MGRASCVAALVSILGVGGCAAGQGARERIVQAPARCETETAPVYFQPGAAELTPESLHVIRAAAQRAMGCEVTLVTVVGLADAAGDPNANLELSKRRAQAVTAALAAAQLPAAEFQVAAAGQAGAVTADGVAAPLRRRAEITLHLAPRK